jgi:pimeloyl-ACP methyl ester carboxylesterase
MAREIVVVSCPEGELDWPRGQETIGVLEYLDRPAHLVGHIDGGDVGLLVAMRRPDLVQRLVLIGSNFHHAGLIPIGEMSPDDPSGVYDMFATMYSECSPDGREHFDAFLAKTYAMWASEPELTPTDLAAVTVRTGLGPRG